MVFIINYCFITNYIIHRDTYNPHSTDCNCNWDTCSSLTSIKIHARNINNIKFCQKTIQTLMKFYQLRHNKVYNSCFQLSHSWDKCKISKLNTKFWETPMSCFSKVHRSAQCTYWHLMVLENVPETAIFGQHHLKFHITVKLGWSCINRQMSFCSCKIFFH